MRCATTLNLVGYAARGKSMMCIRAQNSVLTVKLVVVITPMKQNPWDLVSNDGIYPVIVMVLVTSLAPAV
jgi:hypothetical protein